MWDFIDTAHPVLTITIVMVLLIALWMISVLQTRLRVAENRMDSLEQELRTIDEELAVVLHAPSGSASSALSDPDSVRAALAEAAPGDATPGDAGATRTNA